MDFWVVQCSSIYRWIGDYYPDTGLSKILKFRSSKKKNEDFIFLEHFFYFVKKTFFYQFENLKSWENKVFKKMSGTDKEERGETSEEILEREKRIQERRERIRQREYAKNHPEQVEQ